MKHITKKSALPGLLGLLVIAGLTTGLLIAVNRDKGLSQSAQPDKAVYTAAVSKTGTPAINQDITYDTFVMNVKKVETQGVGGQSSRPNSVSGMKYVTVVAQLTNTSKAAFTGVPIVLITSDGVKVTPLPASSAYTGIAVLERSIDPQASVQGQIVFAIPQSYKEVVLGIEDPATKEFKGVKLDIK